MRWLNAWWPDEYDITYVTANSRAAPTQRDTDVTYDGTNHFEEVVYLGDDAWDPELKSVPPAPIRDGAIEVDAAKVVVHFLLPHLPYISDTSIEELSYGQLKRGDERVRPNEILAGVQNDTVRKAYYDNLTRVWEDGVESLFKAYKDRRVVITAEQGELLGENSYYGYGRRAASVVIEPWLVVSNSHSVQIPWSEDSMLLSEVVADYNS